MTARGTGFRIAGAALASLCVSTATRAQQVVYAISNVGCFGVVCVPAASSAALSALRLRPDLAAFGGSSSSSLAAFTREHENAETSQDEPVAGGVDGAHFNRATVVTSGVAFGLLVSLLKSSNDERGPESAPGLSVPLLAHLETAQTSDVVVNPEPTTQALMASGLIVVGLGLLRRRRRRSIA